MPMIRAKGINIEKRRQVADAVFAFLGSWEPPLYSMIPPPSTWSPVAAS